MNFVALEVPVAAGCWHYPKRNTVGAASSAAPHQRQGAGSGEHLGLAAAQGRDQPPHSTWAWQQWRLRGGGTSSLRLASLMAAGLGPATIRVRMA